MGGGVGRVFHIAEAGNWPSIRRDGLLSAASLVARAGNLAVDRAAIAGQRVSRVTLSDGAVIRDQTPMPPAALRACLVGITPARWYALLNGKVFFWCDPDRVERHLRACRRTPQIVLEIDGDALLSRHRERAYVAPFNTGNARRKPATRGRATFVPWTTWLETRWASEAEALGIRQRPRGHAPVELTIDGAVPDILDFVVGTRAVPASA